jgi:hypothetical protein
MPIGFSTAPAAQVVSSGVVVKPSKLSVVAASESMYSCRSSLTWPLRGCVCSVESSGWEDPVESAGPVVPGWLTSGLPGSSTAPAVSSTSSPGSTTVAAVSGASSIADAVGALEPSVT